jgi:hypothetical protein
MPKILGIAGSSYLILQSLLSDSESIQDELRFDFYSKFDVYYALHFELPIVIDYLAYYMRQPNTMRQTYEYIRQLNSIRNISIISYPHA